MIKTFLLKFRKNPPEFPSSPIAEIILAKRMKDENSDDIILTPNCLTFQEIDFQINKLIGELENIRKEARKKFI
jgi:hypothetical protein